MKYEKFIELLKVHDLYLGDMTPIRDNGKWSFTSQIYANKGSITIQHDDWNIRTLRTTQDNPNKVINELFNMMTNNTIEYNVNVPTPKKMILKWNGNKFILYNQDGKEISIKTQRNEIFKTILNNTDIHNSHLTKTGRIYYYKHKAILEYVTSSKNVWIDEQFYKSVPKELLEELENEVRIFLGGVNNINHLYITYDSHDYNNIIKELK